MAAKITLWGKALTAAPQAIIIERGKGRNREEARIAVIIPTERSLVYRRILHSKIDSITEY